MNYKRIYEQLVHKRKSLIPSDVYTETHHIIPKCMGGTDNSDNLVVLTAREHYIAHLLLVNMYKDDKKVYFKLLNAYMLMAHFRGKTQYRKYKINSKIYEQYKIKFSKLQSINQTGGGNTQHNTRWVYSNKLRISKKISKCDTIPKGWHAGRVINFSYLDAKCKLCNNNLFLKKQSRRQFCDKCIEFKGLCSGELLRKKYIMLYYFYISSNYKSLIEFSDTEYCDVSAVQLSKSWKMHIPGYTAVQGRPYSID